LRHKPLKDDAPRRAISLWTPTAEGGQQSRYLKMTGATRRAFSTGKTSRKTLAWGGKISMLQPEPLRWPRDVHVLIGPGPEHQEKQL
jgi:hypothetical protein